MFKDGWWCFQGVPYISLQMFWLIPLYILHHTQSCHTWTNIWCCSVLFWPLCPLGTSTGSSMCSLLWNVPGHHICYRCSCSFHIDFVSKVPLCHIFCLFGWCCCCIAFYCFYSICLLFVEVILYLLPTEDTCNERGPSLICFSSVLSSSELEHTALALCVRVLITLNLQARLWWLSHWRYKSVCVGFL